MNEICYQIRNNDDIEAFLLELFPPTIAKSKKIISYSNNNGLPWLRCLFERFPPEFTIVVEESHVDREYRDSYYLYFSSQHFDVSRFCIRLSFFNKLLNQEMFFDPDKKIPNSKGGAICNKEYIQEAYIGCCTIRPLPSHAIGKTLIDPQKLVHDTTSSIKYLRRAFYRTTIHGMKLSVEAFPFSTQDGETTCCVENTILNLLDYFSTRYADYHRALPSEIIGITQTNSFQRVLPIVSTDFRMLVRVLTELRFYPRHYSSEFALLQADQLQELVYYYIESGIPVALGLTKIGQEDSSDVGHSVICIGHSDKNASKEQLRVYIEEKLKKKVDSGDESLCFFDTAEFYKTFVIMDDMAQPYEEHELNDLKILSPTGVEEPMRVSNITVPLYRRMYMEARDARAIFEEIEANTSEIGVHIHLQRKGIKCEGVIKRMFLISGHNYKIHLLSKVDGMLDYKKVVDKLPFPHFVWVCEYFIPDDYLGEHPASFGELVLDGTSDSAKGRNSMILYRFLDKFSFRWPDEGGDTIIKRIKSYEAKFDIPEKQPACFYNLTPV